MKYNLFTSLITTVLLLTGCSNSGFDQIEAANPAEQIQSENNQIPIAKDSSLELVASLTPWLPTTVASEVITEPEFSSEASTETKSETKSESKSETKSETKSESKSETKSESLDTPQANECMDSSCADKANPIEEYCEVKAGNYRIRNSASTLYSCDIQTESFTLALNEKKYLRCSAGSGLAGAIKLACLGEVAQYDRKKLVYDLGVDVSDAKPFDWVRFSGAPDFTSGKEMIPVGDNGSRGGSFLKIDNFPCDPYFDITTSAYGGVRLLGRVTQRSAGTILSSCLKNGNDDLVIVKMRCSGRSAVNYPAGGAELIGNWEVHQGFDASLDASGESCSAITDSTVSSSTRKWIPAPN